MKKLIAICTLLTFVLNASYVIAGEVSDFIVDEGVITAYNGNDEKVVIPQEIDGVTIIGIGVNAFSENSVVKSITIPATVETIGSKDMADFGKDIFNNTSNLEEIKVDLNNSYFKDIDGVLVNTVNNTLIKYPANKPGVSYVVPDEIKNIANLAFKGLKELKDIYFNNPDVNFNAPFCIEYNDDITLHCYKDSTADSYGLNSFNVLYIVDKADLNMDGSVTAADAATLLANILNGNNEIKISDYVKVADLNNDGSLTAVDAACILNQVLNGTK